MPLHREDGIALIVVLGVVSLFATLSAMLITSSKIAAVTSKVNAERSKAKYRAESFTAYAQWMIVTFNFANRTGGIDQREEQEVLWIAGGNIPVHDYPDGGSVEAKVLNIKRGDDIRELPSMVNRRMQSTEDDELKDLYEELLAVYSDYVDQDNKFRHHPEYGMENEDYEDLGLERFPRNGNLQFREEMYWIRNIEFWLGGTTNLEQQTTLPEEHFSILAPRGIQNPYSAGAKPDARSVTLDYLRTISEGELTGADLQEFERCRRDEAMRDQQLLKECLDVDLVGKLQQYVDFQEDTSVVTLDIIAYAPGGEISRRLVSTINLRDLPNQVASSDVGPVQTLPYWQKIFY